jgi:protein-S-isoprenylcysteine O-methyltransferase
MKSYFDTAVYWSWLVLFLVWLPGWVTGKRPSNVPNPFLQIPVWVLIIISFVLLLYPGMNGLSLPITPHNMVLGISGLVLVFAGVAFAIWARFTLGSNWSGIIMGTKEEHDLVQSGPYAIVRHPIYAGILIAMVGTALTTGRLASYIGLAAGLVAFMIRVNIEEKLMSEQFGETHKVYRRRTKKLIPFVW